MRSAANNLFYCNINKIRDEEVNIHLQRLPQFMWKDVTRCVFVTDQKSKLIARLMLQKSMKDTGNMELIHQWKRDNNNKPFVEGWFPFNISHSADFVIFAYGNTDIGIDIEKRIKLNYEEMMEYFHPREQEYIMTSKNIQEAFYEIWVKKEAILKAMGAGIVNGLKEFDCVGEHVNYQGKDWYFYLLKIHPDYTSYLCSPDKRGQLNIREFMPETVIDMN